MYKRLQGYLYSYGRRRKCIWDATAWQTVLFDANVKKMWWKSETYPAFETKNILLVLTIWIFYYILILNLLWILKHNNVLNLNKHYLVCICVELNWFSWISQCSLRNHAYSNILKISSPKTESFKIKILAEAVLLSTYNLCFLAEIRKLMYTPVNLSFTI